MMWAVRIVCSLLALFPSGCFDGRELAEEFFEVRDAAADAYCECNSQEACDSTFGSYYRADGWNKWDACVVRIPDALGHGFRSDLGTDSGRTWARIPEIWAPVPDTWAPIPGSLGHGFRGDLGTMSA